MSRYYRSFLVESGPSYTARTTAFATATSITDTTILNALNTFDLGLISNSLDTKMYAIYPFVGNTATTQKYNFMDARDLDVAFRLQFNGGSTFSSNGYKPNGSNAYADTFLNPTNFTQNSFSFGSYLRDTASYNCFIGSLDTYRNYLLPIGTSYYCQINSSGFASSIIMPDQSTKMHIISRISSTTASTYINGSLLFNDNQTSNGKTNRSIWIGALNSNDVVKYYSSNEQSFSFIADGINSTEVTNFTNLVNNLQTALSRAV